jgi:hypothetical protein
MSENQKAAEGGRQTLISTTFSGPRSIAERQAGRV